jgi:predicted SnoaL-like aldol condensation-catalyzing enzyme
MLYSPRVTSREVNITFYQRTLLGTSANQKRYYLKPYINMHNPSLVNGKEKVKQMCTPFSHDIPRGESTIRTIFVHRSLYITPYNYHVTWCQLSIASGRHLAEVPVATVIIINCYINT